MSEARPDRTMAYLFALIGALFLLLATGVGSLGAYALNQAGEVASFPETEAVMVMASSSSGFDHNEGGYVTTSYYTYEYEVAGQRYDNNWQQGGSLTWEQGEKFPVYYDPDHPEVSYMERRDNVSIVLGFGLAALMTLISLPFWWFAAKSYLNPQGTAQPS